MKEQKKEWVRKTKDGYSFRLTNDWVCEDQAIYDVKRIKVPKNGILCLVGCNGSGKTTTIEQMAQWLHGAGMVYAKEMKGFNALSGLFGHSDEPPTGYIVNFDKAAKFLAVKEGQGASDWLSSGDVDHFLERSRSNGESVIYRLGGAFDAVKQCAHKALKENVPLWVFVDDADAGTSIDVMADLKVVLTDLHLSLSEKKIEHYIVVASNSFELVRGLDCVYVKDMSPVRFDDYDSFREFVIRSRSDKEDRDLKRWKREDAKRAKEAKREERKRKASSWSRKR